jgi:hypothetical protein
MTLSLYPNARSSTVGRTVRFSRCPTIPPCTGLVALRSELDPATWEQSPADDGELPLGAIADWGPAEDWADRDDASR